MPVALQAIGIGAAPGDNTGDPGRTAFGKANYNFSVLAGAVEDAELKAFTIACTAKGEDVVVGTELEHFHMPYSFVLLEVQAGVAVAPTGADLVVDILADGYSVLDTNGLSIPAGSYFSTELAPVTTILTKGSVMTIDANQVGSTVAGQWLKVTLVGYIVLTSF